MPKIRSVCGGLLALMISCMSFANADTLDAFAFFQEEAEVISGSRIPSTQSRAVATTYLITREDIQNAGVQNIWDLLRTVPGVDVMQTRTRQAEVTVRGLNQPLSNRTLILLDGKSVLNALFDFITWDSIPVTLDEIERIEIVEGPSSAVYGANAINGVINIITRTPEQLAGGQLRYGVGDRNTQLGSFVVGHQYERQGYRLAADWHSMNQFQDASAFASQAGKLNGLWSYRFSDHSDLSLSGAVVNLNTETSIGSAGTAFDKGFMSFGRVDYRYRDTRLRSFWNHGRTRLDQFQFPLNSPLYYDTYDAEVQQSAQWPWHQQVVAGVSFRLNTARSPSIGSERVKQNLWAFFFEDRWDINSQWTLDGSGRIDRHPFAPLMFSPRGSLAFMPVPEHVLRASAGTSFRNPTLTENYIDLDLTVPNDGTALPNPPYSTIVSHTQGNKNLDQERVQSVELAHNGDFGRVKSTLALFHYQLKQVIRVGRPQAISATPPTFRNEQIYINDTGTLKAWGGEVGFKILLVPPWLSAFTNYSYQYLHDDTPHQAVPNQSPRHKVNTGATVKHKGFTGQLWSSWVDHTVWFSQLSGDDYRAVSPYTLVNAYAGYSFGGRWRGLALGVTAFNLLNHDHFETLGSIDALHPGQNGEIIKSHWICSLSYTF